MPIQSNLRATNKIAPKIRRKRASITAEPDSRLAALNLLQGKPTSPTQTLAVQRQYGNRATVGLLDANKASPTLQRALITKPEDVAKWQSEDSAESAVQTFGKYALDYGIGTMTDAGLATLPGLAQNLFTGLDYGSALMAQTNFASKEKNANASLAINIGKFVVTCILVPTPLGIPCATVALLWGVSNYLDEREKIAKERRWAEITASMKGKLEAIIAKNEERLKRIAKTEKYSVRAAEKRSEEKNLGRFGAFSYSSNDDGAARMFVEQLDWKLFQKINTLNEQKVEKWSLWERCVRKLLEGGSSFKDDVETFRKNSNELPKEWKEAKLNNLREALNGMAGMVIPSFERDARSYQAEQQKAQLSESEADLDMDDVDEREVGGTMANLTSRKKWSSITGGRKVFS